MCGPSFPPLAAVAGTWSKYNTGTYIGTIAFAYLCFVMFTLFFFALIVFQSAVSEELGIGEPPSYPRRAHSGGAWCGVRLHGAARCQACHQDNARTPQEPSPQQTLPSLAVTVQAAGAAGANPYAQMSELPFPPAYAGMSDGKAGNPTGVGGVPLGAQAMAAAVAASAAGARAAPVSGVNAV
jgi:hypothetical protein